MTIDLSLQFPLYVQDEFPLVASCVQLLDSDILDIGCGNGETSRRAAVDGGARRVVGIEVDEIQHRKNVERTWPANLEFRLCGAEALDFPDASFDAVLMFKSLHHVPHELMAQAFEQMHRVLRPGGRVYISEPVYDGPFNDIGRLYHDEGVVRQKAIEAIAAAVGKGLFVLDRQVNFLSPIEFKDFEAYRKRMLGVTHTQHRVSDELMAKIETAFRAHLAPNGANFIRPMRVDLLVRA